MSPENTGNLARQMAAAPMPSKAGKGIADAMREAAVQSSVDSAKATSEAMRSNPIVDLFGLPVFKLGDPSKAYPQTDSKGKEIPNSFNRTMAVAQFKVGGCIQVDCRLYAQDVIKRDATGSYAERTLTVSLPKALTVNRDDQVAQMHLDSWKQSILDAYEAWTAMVDQSIPIRSHGPRLVKRVAVAE